MAIELAEDTVNTELLIAGDLWHVIQAEVHHTQATTPNYMTMDIVPDYEETLPNLPEGDIQKIVGNALVFRVDNALISNRDTDAEEVTLLFAGFLANISSTGENTFEAIAYDPSQQLFNEGKQDSDGNYNNSSFINQKVNLKTNRIEREPYSTGQPYDGGVFLIKASEVARRIAEASNLTDYEIQFGPPFEGVTVEAEGGGQYTGAYDVDLQVSAASPRVRVGDALEKIRKRAKAEWWFSRDGTFYMGVPGSFDSTPPPTVHNLKYIKETTAGLRTPPYQSVKVIGSGIASAEDGGRDKAQLIPENEIVKKVRLLSPVESTPVDSNPQDTVIVDVEDDEELFEPVFEYKNYELSTDQQASNAARKIAEELLKQQAQGKITVVGFPEVYPFDGVRMPNTENQPMGGYVYGVYEVVHKLSSDEGYVTDIHVSGPSEVTNFAVLRDKAPVNTDVDNPLFYTEQTERPGGPGTDIGEVNRALNDDQFTTEDLITAVSRAVIGNFAIGIADLQ